MAWNVIKLLFNLVLFLGTGAEGINAVINDVDAGWTAGFVFCSTGSYLFSKDRNKEFKCLKDQ